MAEHGFLVSRGRIEGRGDGATAKDYDAVRQGKDFREFGRDQQDALAGPGKFLDEGVNLRLRPDIDPAGRFI